MLSTEGENEVAFPHFFFEILSHIFSIWSSAADILKDALDP